MAQLDIARGYAEGEVLLEADLDAIKSGLETFINTTKLNDDNFQTNGIDADTKVIDGTVTTAVLAASSVTGAKIAASAVTTAKIADSNVTTGKIADLAVTTGKILDGTLIGSDFASSSVTTGKRVAAGDQASAASTPYSSASTSQTDVTNATVTITTTGKNVALILQPTAGSAGAGISVDTNQTTATALYRLYRDSDLIASFNFGAYLDHDDDANPLLSAIWQNPINSLFTIDTGASAGSHIYKLTAQSSGGSTTVGVHACYLVAYEIL